MGAFTLHRDEIVASDNIPGCLETELHSILLCTLHIYILFSFSSKNNTEAHTIAHYSRYKYISSAKVIEIFYSNGFLLNGMGAPELQILLMTASNIQLICKEF